MLRLMPCWLALVGCATAVASPASRPAITTAVPYDDMSIVMVEGKMHFLIEGQSFREMLAGVEQEKGELRNIAAKAEAGKAFYEAQSEEMAALAAEQARRTVWAPILAGFGGAATVGVIWALVEGIKAALAAQETR